LASATSVHVSGGYTGSHGRLALNIGLLKSGQMVGYMRDGREPLTVIDVGGKMYFKATPAYLRDLGKSAECPTLCGKYAIAKPAVANGFVRYMGMTETLSLVRSAAQSLLSLTHTTYHGQPALRATFGEPGTVLIMSAAPPCSPLLLDYPGHYQLVFT